MEIVALKMLFIASVSAQFGKHVYVQQSLNWTDAQAYCRHKYTDLSPLTTTWEQDQLRTATAGKVRGAFWVGLYKNQSQWRWSGGGLATNIIWDKGQPDIRNVPAYGAVCYNCPNWSGWHDGTSLVKLHFFCYNMTVTEDKMSWEAALSHCSQTHSTLTSLTSETQHLLARTEIQQDHITERVWIGLRYLKDRWLWVNGDPLDYKAWAQGDQDHLCPMWNRCGALTKEGLWESWDCSDKLNFICY